MSSQATGVRTARTPVPDGRTVVRALVALKLRLLRNGLRRSRGPVWPVLLLGPLYGALVAFLGVRLAAGRLLERIPEILAKTVER